MKFDNFEIHASPFLSDAYCKRCHNSLIEVSNGWFSSAMFCPKCELVYIVKLIQVPKSKVSKEFLEQARKDAASKKKNNEN